MALKKARRQILSKHQQVPVTILASFAPSTRTEQYDGNQPIAQAALESLNRLAEDCQVSLR